jgi:hypothetical protein
MLARTILSNELVVVSVFAKTSDKATLLALPRSLLALFGLDWRRRSSLWIRK